MGIGSIQAFVYDPASELWMRVADSRFILSDFYSALPSLGRSKKASNGELAKLDDAVRLGATSSTLKASRRGSSHADQSYRNITGEDGYNDAATRSHCEDRMACALALNSQGEFEYWLTMYARTLAMSGNEASLRLLVDLLLGETSSRLGEEGQQGSSCWWLSLAPKVLSLDRTKLVRTVVIPEISKNRSLQRMTNEIALEVESLASSMAAN